MDGLHLATDLGLVHFLAEMRKLRRRLASRGSFVVSHKLPFPSYRSECSMNCVNARCSHYTPLVNRVLCGVLLCALAGCWQEVAYTPPDGGDGPESPAPTSAQADEDAHDFADDLATSLAAQPPAAPSGETASAAGGGGP